MEDGECSECSECFSAEEGDDAAALQSELEEIKSLRQRLDAIQTALAKTLQSSKERLAILQSLPELVARGAATGPPAPPVADLLYLAD